MGLAQKPNIFKVSVQAANATMNSVTIAIFKVTCSKEMLVE